MSFSLSLSPSLTIRGLYIRVKPFGLHCETKKGKRERIARKKPPSFFTKPGWCLHLETGADEEDYSLQNVLEYNHFHERLLTTLCSSSLLREKSSIMLSASGRDIGRAVMSSWVFCFLSSRVNSCGAILFGTIDNCLSKRLHHRCKSRAKTFSTMFTQIS